MTEEDEDLGGVCLPAAALFSDRETTSKNGWLEWYCVCSHCCVMGLFTANWRAEASHVLILFDVLVHACACGQSQG